MNRISIIRLLTIRSQRPPLSIGQRRSYHFAENIFGFSNASPLTSYPLDLIDAYRRFGFRAAQLDPLGLVDNTTNKEALKSLVERVNVGDESVSYGGFNGNLNELANHLEKLYCEEISVEFMHLHSTAEQEWFAREFEAIKNQPLAEEQRKAIAEVMLKSYTFEKFLETKFPQLKRYGGEGAEAGVAFHDHVFKTAPAHGVKEVVWGGAHRGRMALHTTLFGLPPETIFRKIRGMPEFPDNVQGIGDVLSHLNCHHDFNGPNGVVHISTVPNPSHLEVAGPVAVGKARARARTLGVGDYGDGRVGDAILPLHFHGDGAFTGQGVVWETLTMAAVPHFRVGGSIHLVVNNQVAFTAERDIGRSSLHCTDAAKAVDAPVIHVNANSPEDVVRAAELALRYRQKFRKDVFVNMIAFRRFGHNELDDPRFTQPRMYSRIDAAPSVVQTYVKQLQEEGVVKEEWSRKIDGDYATRLTDLLKSVDEGNTKPIADHLKSYWSGYGQAPSAVTKWDTGVDTELLKYIGAASVKFPDGFNIHPHLQKTHIKNRLQRIESGVGIDWSTAEAFAFGSLMLQGYDVRISGQDVGRATFSHRHAVLIDQETDRPHIPLNHISPEQKNFLECANSPLSEEAVLGFEYGFSIENPKRLVIWEAQFGDFFNTAQVQIDTLIAGGENKWLIQSGLVMMLPHGIDGAGPEHSSAHIERFLQLADSREDQKPVDGDNVNMHVANPTTSAQYFHLLRRQCLSNFRKPLILISPKVLLRHPAAASSLDDFAPGKTFQPVIGEEKNDTVKKVIFTSGKHAYPLADERKKRKADDVAIIRLERICPFPVAEIREALTAFPNAQKYVWSQEEARNAGCWSFVSPRFANALGINLQYAGRPELSWVATSIGSIHEAEAAKVFEDTFAA